MSLELTNSNIDLTTSGVSGAFEQHSNFRAFGIGKESEAQKKRREKIKKAVNDAGKNISQTTTKAFKDAGKNISETTKKTAKDAAKSTKDAIKDIGDKIGDKWGGGVAVHAFDKYNPATVTMRGAILAVLNTNTVDMAHALSLIKNDKNQKYWDEILQKWWMWGGDKEHFNKAVEKGKNKKPYLKDLIEKITGKKYSADGNYANAEGKKASSAGNVILASAALLGIASGVLGAIYPPEPATKSGAIITGSAAAGFGAMGSIFKSYAKEHGVSSEKSEIIPVVTEIKNTPENIPVTVPTDEKTLNKIVDEIKVIEQAEEKGKDYTLVSAHKDPASKDILGIDPTFFWIGVGAIALIGAYLILRKPSKTT